MDPFIDTFPSAKLMNYYYYYVFMEEWQLQGATAFQRIGRQLFFCRYLKSIDKRLRKLSLRVQYKKIVRF